MALLGSVRKALVVASLALCAAFDLCSLDAFLCESSNSSSSSVFAQEQRGGRGGRRFGRNGRGGPGGFNIGEFIANMNAERFERIKSSPFAEQMKSRVGEEQWGKWESGDFTPPPTAAEAAADAQAIAEGRPLERELTDEEKEEAEKLLRAGSVPDFNADGTPKYSIETEAEYYAHAMARRDDTLVASAPLTLRFYVRYLLAKYDSNGNGVLEQEEWEDKLVGAQAVDLNGDWTLTDQELLFYLTRFAKDRTILSPDPPKFAKPRANFLVGTEEDAPLVIRTASAAPRRVTQEEADREREDEKGSDEISDMSEEEIESMMKENNPALESVDDDDLLDALLTDMDESSVREYAASPAVVRGAPVWFLARDRNGDGQLTLREFAPNLSLSGVAQFGKLDANGDGLIDVEEVKKAMGNNGAPAN